MSRLGLMVLHLVIGLAAIGAGQALAIKPSGASLTFDVEWLQGSPFSDYRIPGLFMLLVIGPVNLISALAQWRRKQWAPEVSAPSGVILLAWIAIQTAIIGSRPWSQAMWWAVFAATTALAVKQLKDALHGRYPKPQASGVAPEVRG